MSLQTRISDLITAVGTDIKALKVMITGSSSGTLASLTTTDKTSIIAAINETKAGNSGSPPDASETVKGIMEIATQAETTTGTDDLRAITPLKLAQKLSGFSVSQATETALGTAELATQIEVNTGTDDLRIVTPLKFQTRLAAYAQPLDSDLTAIAALTTTAYGRGVLALADSAALTAMVQDASETAKGVAELATQTEVNTGTDDVRVITPLKFQTRLAAYAQPLDSDLTSIAALATTAYGRAFLELANQAALQALLGLDTDVALAANSDAKIATQKAVKAYADGLLDANNAFVYKGVQDCSANPNYPAANAGWAYKVSVAGKIGGVSGLNVEIGDTLVCLVDSSVAGNQATVGTNWIILQTNIDGAMVGPSSSVASNIPTFSGTTGKVVADSGVSVSTDGTMATNNNTKVPTEGAIRTYLGTNYYTQTNLGNYDTDLVALYTTAKA
jgi:hypothetical protein